MLYDTIGHGYRERRRPDPRIGAAIAAGLGDARSVINVGAGTGSYEPMDADVLAVEPSRVMLAQRARDAAPVVRGLANGLPCADASFDAALAILTVHHWDDVEGGLREMARVARDRVVILTFDTRVRSFWLADYLPEIQTIDEAIMPPMSLLEQWLGPLDVSVVPIPADCTDGFLGAYWKRPEVYLDPAAQAAISTFSKFDDPEPGLSRLRDDLESGAWHERYAGLADREAIDLGYRLVVAHPGHRDRG